MKPNTFKISTMECNYPLKDEYDVGDIILVDAVYHEIIEIDQVNQTMTIAEIDDE